MAEPLDPAGWPRDEQTEARVRRLVDQARRAGAEHGPDAMLEVFEHHRLLAEAAEAAAGSRHLTIWHGDLETDQDVERLGRLTRLFWTHPAGHGRSTRGGNDSTTFVAGPPSQDAEQVLAAVERLAGTLNPGWWRITTATA
jgi:hypothetical protein